jgi:GTP 3',8-cyclase
MGLLHPPTSSGKISALKCEVNPVEHCNLSCLSCSHLSPIQQRYVVDPADLERDLTVLGRHYHARWVRLVGGEPLLHPKLDLLLDAIRASGVADKIMVVTNGVLLPRLPAAVWSQVDRIDVSQYPGAELREADRILCEDLARRNDVRIHFDRIDTFRISYSERGAASRDLVQRIYRSCGIVHDMRCHTVARGYFYKCPQSYFLPRTLTGANIAFDSVRICEAPSFAAELRALLARDEPLDACRHCLGTAGRRVEHTQIRRRNFREPQSLPSEALVDRRYLHTAGVLTRRVVARTRHTLGRDAH